MVPSSFRTSITIFPIFPPLFIFEDAEGFAGEIGTNFLRITSLSHLHRILTIEDVTPDLFSWDEALQIGDLEIGSVYVGGLAAGGQQTVTISGTIPSSLTGTFYMGAIADSGSSVLESNENNNSLADNQISISGQ